MVECSSSPGSPGEVKLHVMGQPPPPPVHSTPATVAVLLRIATDESFTSFHPEAHLPLSLLRGRPVYMEVSLLDPPEPGLVLLVHSCLAYSQAPYASWMLVYDGCPSRGDSEPLPSPRPDPHHIRRFTISGFLSLHSESPPYMAEGGYSHLEDPEKCALLQMVTALYAASAVSLTQWKHKRGTSPTRSQQ
ncbi:zona pellucida sperm-binding protein 1-like isoform X4 [Anarrhichthys ocellatus]|nr:zona pellucida sperm-binding protein 1-like isoform X4 [Anarrhichthys ocellatus]